MSVSFPWQFEPPCAGSGLLHSWCRDLDPLPHVAEHEFQSCHVPQFPFTKYIKWNISVKKEKRLQLKNHHNLIVFIIPIMINFTSCRPHWKFAVYHDFAVCGHYCRRIFPKDRKASALLSTLLSISKVSNHTNMDGI